MDESLRLYKNLIDGLAKLRRGVLGKWVKEKGWPDLPENRKINEFIFRLSNEEKEILSDILECTEFSVTR